MRLNLGGRDKPIPGFLTVDLFEGDGVDIKADLSRLYMVNDGEAEEIYASHCLEHFSHTKTVDVLKEWHRTLKRYGKLYVSVPDFDAMVTLYQQFGLNDFVRNMLWGDQGYDLAYHYTGFTYPSLAKALMSAGFSDVKRIEQMPHGLSDCSTLVDTVTFKPVSINCEATK